MVISPRGGEDEIGLTSEDVVEEKCPGMETAGSAGAPARIAHPPSGDSFMNSFVLRPAAIFVAQHDRSIAFVNIKFPFVG